MPRRKTRRERHARRIPVFSRHGNGGDAAATGAASIEVSVKRSEMSSQ